jgi:acetyl-CoA acetyltransferase
MADAAYRYDALVTLAYERRARGGGYGVAAICIGVGQGLAVLHA